MFAWGPCRERHEDGLWMCCVPVTFQNTQGGLREQGHLASVSYQAGRIHPFEPPSGSLFKASKGKLFCYYQDLSSSNEMLMGIKLVVAQGEVE